MRQFLSTSILFFVSLFCFAGVSYASELFDLTAPAGWTKVQDGEVQQWTHHFRNGDTHVRLDASWTGDSPVVYLVRRPCPTDSKNSFDFASFKPGNVLGIGLACDGQMISDRSLNGLLSQAAPLPSEIMAAINR
ncbi:MAG: hypothetical protein WDZ56_00955 [Candidatus Paceibacterota bacterium]